MACSAAIRPANFPIAPIGTCAEGLPLPIHSSRDTMDFALNDEQKMMIDTVRRFIAEEDRKSVV